MHCLHARHRMHRCHLTQHLIARVALIHRDREAPCPTPYNEPPNLSHGSQILSKSRQVPGWIISQLPGRLRTALIAEVVRRGPSRTLIKARVVMTFKGAQEAVRGGYRNRFASELAPCCRGRHCNDGRRRQLETEGAPAIAAADMTSSAADVSALCGIAA